MFSPIPNAIDQKVDYIPSPPFYLSAPYSASCWLISARKDTFIADLLQRSKDWALKLDKLFYKNLRRIDVISKFYNCITMWLWLHIASHLTSFNQLENFTSV